MSRHKLKNYSIIDTKYNYPLILRVLIPSYFTVFLFCKYHKKKPRQVSPGGGVGGEIRNYFGFGFR